MLELLKLQQVDPILLGKDTDTSKNAGHALHRMLLCGVGIISEAQTRSQIMFPTTCMKFVALRRQHRQ